MPNSIFEFQIANFLATNTRPLEPKDITLTTESEDTGCLICHNPYADPPQDYMHPELPDDEGEYAV